MDQENKMVDLSVVFAEQTNYDSLNHCKYSPHISFKLDVYKILNMSSGWHWCPSAQWLAGKAQGCFTAQQ